MNNPKDYKHIRAWGQMMRSFEYYIQNQQEQAYDDQAPIDAIYKRGEKWHTFSECENESTRADIEWRLSQMK